MNRTSKPRWALFAVLIMSLSAAVMPAAVSVADQTEPVAQDQGVSVVKQPETTPQQAEEDARNADITNRKAPESATAPARKLEEFNPSETIGADSAVSFPIDI